jgi:beta-lactamase regulating signal transducer with metallopeptidase domain
MIAGFLRGLESVFGWLLEASWQASVLVALVLLLQVMLRGRLNPRWHHALWLLVVLRLLLPVLPESALSLFQFTPHALPALTLSVTEPIFVAIPVQAAFPLPVETPAPTHPVSLYTVFALIWLAGALGFLIATALVNRRFARQVRNSPTIDDPHLLEIAAAAQSELGLRRALRLIENPQVQGPAIMGLFHPTLVLPEHVRARFNDEELRFIFLHEFAHLKRGDLLIQWLIALLQILHWFNPVLWYAFRRMRADREPATDALVLSRTGEAEKENYGHVLIKLLEHYHQRHSLPTLVGILEDKDQFKRRFLLIGRFTRGAYGWSMLGVLLIAMLGAIGLTKAKAQDAAAKAEKYLEVIFVETPGAFNGAGSGPRRPGDVLLMLDDPKNNVSELAHVVLKDGPILLKGKTPATFDYTITGDWKISATEPQKIDIRIDDHSVPGLQHAWETKESLSQGQPVVVFQPWKSASHANLLIRIVDHPGSINSATDAGNQSHDTSANPMTMPTNGTLAQMVLALKDSAKAIPADHQRLQILQGFYGADGSWLDVTGILQKSVKNNSLKVSWQQPYTELGGDPAYLQVKTLMVSYRLDGVEKQATFREENSPVGLQAIIPTENEAKGSDLNAQMLAAVQKGDVTTLQKLIEESSGPLPKDEQGNDVLDYLFDYSPPAQAFPLNALAAALKRSDDPNPKLHSGGTPSETYPLLDQAIVDVGLPQFPEVVPSYRAAVKMLLDHGASFANVTDPKIQTLLKAAALGDLAAIQRMIAQGTSINSVDGNGYNALTISVAMHNDDCANWLIDHGADVKGYARDGVYSPLRFAVWRKQLDLVEKLITAGAKPEFSDGGLASAVDDYDQRLFDDLIKAGADPKRAGYGTVTHHGKSWRVLDLESLYVCIKNNQTAMAKTLLEHGAIAEPTSLPNNQNFVYWAVYYNRPEILQALLDHGANPSLQPDRGDSALSLARKSHPDLVPILEKAISAGTKTTDNSSLPPTHLAHLL